MKKSIPYLILGLVVAALIGLFVAGKNRNRDMLDERVTFRKRDKIPYGTFVAYENLKHIFPKAQVLTRRQEPGDWDSISVYDPNQAVIIISPEFLADKYELRNLFRFAEAGNDVFISTMDLPYEATSLLKCDVNSTVNLASYFSRMMETDTLTVSLAYHRAGTNASYTYPGKQFDGYFSNLDTNTTTVLGYDVKGRPDFLHFKAGKGNMYVHLAPMTFTNYFLLHRHNMAYYENIFSLISPGISKIVWDEYYLNKKNDSGKKKQNWLAALLNTRNAAGYKSFAAGFWLLLAILTVYVLMEMRRKQRYIPIVKKLKNDSLDFVKTIGRLYYDKGDHHNLCRKMAAYFLEHVRNRYKLPTTMLNDEFAKALHNKSGVDEEQVRSIVYFIRGLDINPAISDQQLIAFHKQLEMFYKTE